MKLPFISIIIGILIAIAGFVFLLNSKFLFITLGLAVIIAFLPFLISFLSRESREKEKEAMFLEFSRNLIESVKAGTPISKSIVNVSDKNYGPLSEHVKKLANQISLGIPVRQALQTFSYDVGNKAISRAIALIIQAEASGGDIGLILDSVTESFSQIEDIKKERASSVYSLIIQGYIIFLIFLVIMIFVQVKFLPLISQSFSTTEQGMSGVIERSFYILIFIEAFFTGLVTGKLGEGKIRAGIKHSVILMIISFIVLAISKLL
jgi:archaeal flagellar protein FlaJ